LPSLRAPIKGRRGDSLLPCPVKRSSSTQPGGKNVKTFSMCGRCTLRVATPFPSHTSRSPKRSG
ncbi:unnamed protein product, partial [Ascophyllum nodosum]